MTSCFMAQCLCSAAIFFLLNCFHDFYLGDTHVFVQSIAEVGVNNRTKILGGSVVKASVSGTRNIL